MIDTTHFTLINHMLHNQVFKRVVMIFYKEENKQEMLRIACT